jgi:ParB family chromosome partitioning protein
MARRIGLGKGLSALLDNNESQDMSLSEETPDLMSADNGFPALDFSIYSSEKNKTKDVSHDASVSKIPVDKLVPNPGQPRKNFDQTEIQELADSIKAYGIIQPVIAADAGNGSYIIIAGERRTRAARIDGLKTVPAIIRDYTDQKRLEVSLIENIQRSDLNPIEEAAAFKNLMDYSGLSQDELAVKVGKNRSTVANALRLLRLSVEIQKSIEEGNVSSGHARALLSVSDPRARDKLYREILTGNISVRQAEKKASLTGENKGVKKPSGKKRPPEVDAMTEKFISKLGTKVVIEGDLNKGRIHIDYYSMEDLDRLYEILGG